MKTWMFAALALAGLLGSACGISGKTTPDDPGKTDLAILDVTVTPSDTAAVIRWRTSQQTVGTLAYGRLLGSPLRPVSSNASGEHQVTLSDLAPDTQYWYQITAATPLGQRVDSKPDTFRTLPDQDLNDTTAPVIRDISVVGLTPSTATITWHTDDRTIGLVHYGYSQAYGSSAPDSASYARAHSVTLTGLAEHEVHHFRIWARNKARLTAFSDDGTFQTTERPYVEISPDTVLISGNQEFTFDVAIRNASNLAAISFMLAYDPQAVEIVSVREGDFWRLNDGLIPLLRESEDPVRGRIEYACSWRIVFLDGTAVGTLANGGGEIARITARAKGESTSSLLRLVDADESGDGKPETRLLDHNRSEMQFHIRNGWVIRQGK